MKIQGKQIIFTILILFFIYSNYELFQVYEMNNYNYEKTMSVINLSVFFIFILLTDTIIIGIIILFLFFYLWEKEFIINFKLKKDD